MAKATEPVTKTMLVGQFRNRIVERTTMKAKDLMDNEGNWRLHPQIQKDAMTGILNEVGITDALLVYTSERWGGKVIIDGHLRKSLDEEQEWPVDITDLSDEEADKMLLAFDPLGAMALQDASKVLALQETVQTDDWGLRELFRRQKVEAENILAKLAEEEMAEAGGIGTEFGEDSGPHEMELLPFEHYDYVMMMFKSELDWVAAIDTLNLERVTDPRRTNKIGLGRVLNGATVIKLIKDQADTIAALKKELAVLQTEDN